jgi:HSP20 family protein
MALMRLNPLFADLAATKDHFNRLFGRDGVWETEGVTRTGNWVPAVDILEDDHNLTVKAELPGVEAKDVAVTLENNVLTLKGERRIEKEVKKENYHRIEREYGTFARSFALPPLMDPENVRANFTNGLLTITIPKKEHATTRSIEVKVA